MTRSDILKRADEIVNGERQTNYGSPEDNFGLIGQLWTVYLDHLVTAQDVANMMTLFKIARIKTGTGTADSYIDACGYMACGGEIATGGFPKVPEKSEFIDAILSDEPDDAVVEEWTNADGDVEISLYGDGGIWMEYVGKKGLHPTIDEDSVGLAVLQLYKGIAEAEDKAHHDALVKMQSALSEFCEHRNKAAEENDDPGRVVSIAALDGVTIVRFGDGSAGIHYNGDIKATPESCTGYMGESPEDCLIWLCEKFLETSGDDSKIIEAMIRAMKQYIYDEEDEES